MHFHGIECSSNENEAKINLLLFSNSFLFLCVACSFWLSLLRPCVPFTQLVELDFRELLNSTLTKVVIGYITHELYKTSFIENNEFLAIITSFLTKIASFLPKIAGFLTKMTFKTRYITKITIKLVK
jgi:hypothetical protein